MKRIIFLVAVLFSVTTSAQQYSTFGIGVNGGLPIGNLEDSFSFSFGLDVDYLYELSDEISIGAASGLIFYSGKENNGVKPDNKIYIPIAGAVRFDNIFDNFYFGTDLGYAIGISPTGDDGGLYFKPMLGYYASESFVVNAFYSGIKKEQPTFGYLGLGLMFRL